MCDCHESKGIGWQGWSTIPTPVTALNNSHPWVELSHAVSETMPRLKAFPKPIFHRVRSIPEHALNVTEMSFIVHCGTHIDSPRHFYNDGPAFEEIPFDRLWGPGLIWNANLEPTERSIEIKHLADADKLIKPGDIFLLNTRFHENWASSEYEDNHPHLSETAAQWLVEQGIKFFGIDTPTPELPVSKRPLDFNYPVHRKFLSQGILIGEQLTNLTELAGQRVEIMVNALNIAGSDGSPARIIARKIN